MYVLVCVYVFAQRNAVRRTNTSPTTAGLKCNAVYVRDHVGRTQGGAGGEDCKPTGPEEGEGGEGCEKFNRQQLHILFNERKAKESP